MNRAIKAYYTITASPEFREVERLHEKARHDEAQALRHVRQESKREVALNLIHMGMPTDDIAKATGLSYREIDALRINEC